MWSLAGVVLGEDRAGLDSMPGLEKLLRKTVQRTCVPLVSREGIGDVSCRLTSLFSKFSPFSFFNF